MIAHKGILMPRLALSFVLASVACVTAACSNNKACCKDDSSDKMAERALGTQSVQTAPPASETKTVAVAKPVNSVCPIGGDEFNPEGHPAALLRTANNTTIGFCCQHCVTKFDKMDAAGQQRIIELAKANKGE